METKQNQNRDEVEIDLKALFFVLLDKVHIIILALILGALLAFFLSITLFQKKYESSTTIYVLNKQDDSSVTYSDLQTGTQLTKDYAKIIVSRSVTEQVIAQLNLKTEYSDMKGIKHEDLVEMITVTTPTDTRMIEITVTDRQPARAQDIANAVREVAASHISEVMDIESVNVVDYAEMPVSPVSPNVMKNSIIGGLLGFLLACGVIIILFLSDDTIKTPDDVERYLGTSVLGLIPYDESIAMGKKKKKKKKSMNVTVLPENDIG